MGTFEAANFATGKDYLNFDVARASIQEVIDRLSRILTEHNRKSRVELHTPTPFRPDVPMHTHEPYAEAIQETKLLLQRAVAARAALELSRDTIVEVVAKMP